MLTFIGTSLALHQRFAAKHLTTHQKITETTPTHQRLSRCSSTTPSVLAQIAQVWCVSLSTCRTWSTRVIFVGEIAVPGCLRNSLLTIVFVKCFSILQTMARPSNPSSKPLCPNPYKLTPRPLLPLQSNAPPNLQKTKSSSKPLLRNPYLNQTPPSLPPLRSSAPPTLQISKKRPPLSPARVSNLNRPPLSPSSMPPNKKQSVSMSLFQVFPMGLYCLACDLPVGRGIDAVHRHMKAAHPNMLLSIDNFVQYHSKILSAQFHTGLLSEMKARARLPGCLPPMIRLKCSFCEKSYGLQHNFNKHVRVSSGRCTGSRP